MSSKKVRFDDPPRGASGKKAKVVIEIDEDTKDVGKTGESNREIVRPTTSIVEMGLMTFPNVEAARKKQGKAFDLRKMVHRETLLGWSCPCGSRGGSRGNRWQK